MYGKFNQDYEPAEIGDCCKTELTRLEDKLSKENKKDIILVAYERR